MPGMKRALSRADTKPMKRLKSSGGTATRQRLLGGTHKSVVRLRVTTALSNNQWTVRSISHTLGMLANSSSSAQPICGSYRIGLIRVIGPSPSANNVTSISFQEAGDEVNSRGVLVNSSNTEGVSPKIYHKPRPNSVVGQWQNVREDRPLLEFSAPVGTIIELTMYWRLLEDNETPLSLSVPGVVVSGRFYYLPPNSNTDTIV